MFSLRALIGKQSIYLNTKRQIASASSRSFSAFVNHRNTDDNNEDTPFEFTKENYEQIDILLKKYPSNYKESACIPALFLAQKQNNNFLTLSAMNKVAKVLNMAPMQVYEVASFYTMFNRTKVGKYHLQMCGTTPCMIRGAGKVIDAIKQHCNIEMDGTSEDGLFTLSEVECLGACVNAPMMQVNNEYVYEDLDAENIVTILEQWKRGEEPKKGPQIERQHSCGPLGRTSLFPEFDTTVAHDRDFSQAKKDWEEARAKAAAAAAAAKK